MNDIQALIGKIHALTPSFKNTKVDIALLNEIVNLLISLSKLVRHADKVNNEDFVSLNTVLPGITKTFFELSQQSEVNEVRLLALRYFKAITLIVVASRLDLNLLLESPPLVVTICKNLLVNKSPYAEEAVILSMKILKNFPSAQCLDTWNPFFDYLCSYFSQPLPEKPAANLIIAQINFLSLTLENAISSQVLIQVRQQQLKLITQYKKILDQQWAIKQSINALFHIADIYEHDLAETDNHEQENQVKASLGTIYQRLLILLQQKQNATTNDKLDKASILYEMAKLSTDNAELFAQYCSDAFKELIALNDKIPKEKNIAACHRWLNLFASVINSVDNAYPASDKSIAFYQQAIKIFDESFGQLGDIKTVNFRILRLRGYIKIKLAETFIKLNNQEAISIYQEALDDLQKAFSISISENEIIEKSVSYISSEIETSRTKTAQSLLPNCYHRLIELYLNVNKFSDALRMANAALEYLTEIGTNIKYRSFLTPVAVKLLLTASNAAIRAKERGESRRFLTSIVSFLTPEPQLEDTYVLLTKLFNQLVYSYSDGIEKDLYVLAATSFNYTVSQPSSDAFEIKILNIFEDITSLPLYEANAIHLKSCLAVLIQTWLAGINHTNTTTLFSQNCVWLYAKANSEFLQKTYEKLTVPNLIAAAEKKVVSVLKFSERITALEIENQELRKQLEELKNQTKEKTYKTKNENNNTSSLVDNLTEHSAIFQSSPKNKNDEQESFTPSKKRKQNENTTSTTDAIASRPGFGSDSQNQ